MITCTFNANKPQKMSLIENPLFWTSTISLTFAGVVLLAAGIFCCYYNCRNYNRRELVPLHINPYSSILPQFTSLRYDSDDNESSETVEVVQTVQPTLNPVKFNPYEIKPLVELHVSPAAMCA